MPSKATRIGRAKRPSGARQARAKKAKVARSGSVRLEIRLERHAKELIERAAALTGQTMTNFAVSNLLESALETIERHQQRPLSDRDRARFLAALDRPAKPLPSLVKAARLHTKALNR